VYGLDVRGLEEFLEGRLVGKGLIASDIQRHLQVFSLRVMRPCENSRVPAH
jgi:hypothetical protein